MIGWVCKYTPVEVLEAMGAKPVRIDPSVTNFDEADAKMHPNICSYTKGVLETFANADFEGVVLTNCCDSIRRLYDVLKAEYPGRFIYLLDLPRARSGETAALYAERIRAMTEAYAAFSGRCFDEETFRERCAATTVSHLKPQNATGPRVGIVGARCEADLPALLERSGASVAFDMSCAGDARCVRLPDCDACEDLMRVYAAELLRQTPCMRMEDVSERSKRIARCAGQLDGLICHTVKFCDYYSFDYERLRRETALPILKIETDATTQGEGQIRTRVEAFVEALRTSAAAGNTGAKSAAGETKRYVLGVDSGSTSTNAVILNEKRELVASAVLRTGAKAGDSAQKILEAVLKKAKLKKEDVSLIVSTGYGRVSIPYADRNITEITCHARGARYFDPRVRTILDIGGQDSKAIHLDENGEVADFAMNDKCAAGTGRFLEAMARTLEVSIDELGPISLKSKHTVEISSMCTVFAESEVISLIAQNCEKADIAAGVHRAIAGKSAALLSRVSPEPPYMMTGGVAKNPGVVKALEEKLGEKLLVCPEPEIVGACGAALLGLEER
ncbi:MAG: acyl-CoA dehydratase activase [Oscillospiraceae bacterium]|jgi:predicted CoA-substrate-specific enzyme activase